MQIKHKENKHQSFFTDAEELNKLMINLLGEVSQFDILEPCAGKGAFVFPLLDKAKKIDAVEIDEHHIDFLKKIVNPNLNVFSGDFIDYFVSNKKFIEGEISNQYDAIICNPPYGLKWSIEYRKKIKKMFP